MPPKVLVLSAFAEVTRELQEAWAQDTEAGWTEAHLPEGWLVLRAILRQGEPRWQVVLVETDSPSRGLLELVAPDLVLIVDRTHLYEEDESQAATDVIVAKSVVVVSGKDAKRYRVRLRLDQGVRAVIRKDAWWRRPGLKAGVVQLGEAVCGGGYVADWQEQSWSNLPQMLSFDADVVVLLSRGSISHAAAFASELLFQMTPAPRAAGELPPVVPDAQPVREQAPLDPEMTISLAVDHYRALRRVRWDLPRGVSVLVGPNGAGKSTLLDIPSFLYGCAQFGVQQAVDHRGGPGEMRHLDAPPDELVKVGLRVDDVGWTLSFSPKGAGANPLYREELRIGDQVKTSAGAGDEPRSRLLSEAEDEGGEALRPLVRLLRGYRLYGDYDIGRIRRFGSQVSSDPYLHPSGGNFFSVLRNWRDRRETQRRLEFVLAGLREAFPDFFTGLDFEIAGQTVSGRILSHREGAGLASYGVANGWLTAALHLCAVASVDVGGVVAIDEPENGLHPFAIRCLIQSMRAWAEEQRCTVLLASHSPIVLDQFKEEPDRVFVMEPEEAIVPVALDRLHDPDWLAQFSLGYLYAHQRYGAPKPE